MVLIETQGLILSACPGTDGRTPAADLAALRALGASLVLTLVETEKLERLGLTNFGALVKRAGMDWLHLPITDFGVPGEAFLREWPAASADIHARFQRGERTAIHCRAGIGRTGLAASLILIERGLPPAEAIALVRRHRPGAVETEAQLAFVMNWALTA